MSQDAYVTISPHFRVPEGRLEDFKLLCRRFVDTVRSDDGCVRYSWGSMGMRRAAARTSSTLRRSSRTL